MKDKGERVNFAFKGGDTSLADDCWVRLIHRRPGWPHEGSGLPYFRAILYVGYEAYNPSGTKKRTYP